MAHMTRGTFMIYSVVPTFLPATVEVLPQCFAELVQQIRFAADGPARLRFPAQPLDQIDESAFLLFHAVKESGAERRGISVHLPRLQTVRVGPARVIFDGHGTVSVPEQYEVEQLAASLWNTRASVRMGCVTSPTANATMTSRATTPATMMAMPRYIASI